MDDDRYRMDFRDIGSHCQPATKANGPCLSSLRISTDPQKLGLGKAAICKAQQATPTIWRMGELGDAAKAVQGPSTLATG